MKYVGAMLLGAALLGGSAARSAAQTVVPVQYQDRDDRRAFNEGYRQGHRRTGHSFRPTHDDNYHHADRGYYPGFGSKNYYKQLYREGYAQGYQQGYDNGWRR